MKPDAAAQLEGCPLFEKPSAPELPAYRRNSPASLAAAAKLAPSIRAIHMLVLAEMKKRGPMNADTCAKLLSMDELKIRPRFSELGEGTDRNPGLLLIEHTGEYAPSRCGNPMAVFRLSERGKQALKDTADSLHAATVRDNASAA